MDYKITTVRLTKKQKETLEGLAQFNRTSIAEIIRALIELFMADRNLQTRTLGVIKKNELYTDSARSLHH